jgi:hypothetical protein
MLAEEQIARDIARKKEEEEAEKQRKELEELEK